MKTKKHICFLLAMFDSSENVVCCVHAFQSFHRRGQHFGDGCRMQSIMPFLAVSLIPGNLYGCQPENRAGNTPQIIHLFIGFSIVFTIHFGLPVFLETPI